MADMMKKVPVREQEPKVRATTDQIHIPDPQSKLCCMS